MAPAAVGEARARREASLARVGRHWRWTPPVFASYTVTPMIQYLPVLIDELIEPRRYTVILPLSAYSRDFGMRRTGILVLVPYLLKVRL